MDLIYIIKNTVKDITIWSALDILVVSFIFYKVYMLIKETRAEQLLKGILLVVLLIPISSVLQLDMLNLILGKTITIGVICLVILFQPEIRRGLEHIGRSAFNEKHILEDEKKMEVVVNEIVNAVVDLSKTKTGALIIIEQLTGLGEIITTGTRLDALVSSALLENIFVVNTPLHDGATIIRNGRIVASGCFLPLTNNNELNKKLGTRHRAAIGVSEVSDALVVVVSEETGTVSLAYGGRLTRNYTRDKLKDILVRLIKKNSSKKLSFKERVMEWKQKREKNS